jgi:hypothetical protein
VCNVCCNNLVTVPLSQVKSLYTALDSNKENHKPLGKEMNVKESESKKTQKKQPEKKKEVKVKPPVPKSLEMAVRLVSYLYRQQIFGFRPATSTDKASYRLIN